ncbi:uncharacterized protein BX664DRAFT_318778 [Halteromyces radiatus]|uniref:uncharacterized protein n=1 Tax=Halteromyces radiatus TaxID=101107 RepID=UPI00221EC2BA|nr:uncharacterized protein BX664DRAFT_318778 [Halteromyces radiatus]KAI8098468.1 hypothetical protein BX664DRAFT_318778 [Halteromyces radiatus]
MAIDYANKTFLAPMVRVGTLPMRLLALRYGADLVWTEELVDKRIIGSVRKYNVATGVTEYWKGQAMCFATHPDEKGKVILQLGTADPDLALQAALTLKDEIAGVDLNCGCPKKFSVQGGMGAALLTNPDRLKAILTKLVENLDIPVTCKIRILESEEETLKLAKMIESTGVKALTIHCRTRNQRSTTPARWEAMKQVTKTLTKIPVVVNGDVMCWNDIAKAKEVTGASSVMIARGAQDNPSAFRKEGLVPFDEVAKEYLKTCVDVNNVFVNTKYVLLCMNTNPKHTKSEFYQKMQRTKSTEAMCELFDLLPYYQQAMEKQKSRQEAAMTLTETEAATTNIPVAGDKRSHNTANQDGDDDDDRNKKLKTNE